MPAARLPIVIAVSMKASLTWVSQGLRGLGKVRRETGSVANWAPNLVLFRRMLEVQLVELAEI